MKKAHERDQADSTWNKIPDDEPVFILRGRDRAAPGTIRAWAERAKRMGCPTPKWQEAMDCAMAFEEWGRFNEGLVKVPD